MQKIFYLAISFFFALRMYSCDCPPIVNISPENIESYDVIFKGHVDSVSTNGSKDIVWFTVLEVYKGKLIRITSVVYNSSTSCQMKMEKGDEWLVYAEYKNFGKLEVNVCSRSRKYFVDETKDFYVVNNGISYIDETNFLKTNIGKQTLVERDPNKGIQIQRELIHPNHSQMLYSLLASLIGFFVIYFLFKKFVK